MNDQEIQKLAREILAARLLEAQPSKERVAEIIRVEIIRFTREQLFDVRARELSDDVKPMIRHQLRVEIQEWLSEHLPSALAEVSLDTGHLKSLIAAEVELIKKHVDQLVREETSRLVKQAVGTKVGEKVAKLLSLFDKVLVQS